jgi:hypothetical protein
MSALLEEPLKILPFSMAAFITYRIYNCPCKRLMECTKTSSLILITALGAMLVFGYPLKSNA